MAVARGDRALGDEHLLLALTTGRGPATVVLADHGVTHEAVLRVLDVSGGRRAG